jgi:hypothetical protein
MVMDIEEEAVAVVPAARDDTIHVEPVYAPSSAVVESTSMDPVDRVVRCLDIDGIAKAHRQAIDAFRQIQPALEARGVRAPHLLLLLAAQLELAEATKMMLDHLHLQRQEQRG